MAFAPTASNGHQLLAFYAHTSYTPSQVQAITYEMKTRSSAAGMITIHLSADHPNTGGWPWDYIGTGTDLTTSDQWLYRTETDMNTYMTSGGLMGLGLCGCPKTSTYSFTTYLNVVNFLVYLKPTGGAAPVANFSGNPTSGTAPVDASPSPTLRRTRPPRGRGRSATATPRRCRIPSHSYTSNELLHGGADRDQLVRQQHQYQEQLHHRRHCASGQLLRHADLGQRAAGGELHGLFDEQPTAWSWTFGDSNTSTAQNPSHTYSSAGTYTVALTATNAYGNNTNTKNNYITVNSGGSAPVANFSGTPTSGNAPLTVSFTDSSTNTPTSWSWTFGDSNTSTVQNPSHTYSSTGTYTVALTATNAYGNNTNTKNNYITVSSGGVVTMSIPTPTRSP